MRNMDRQIDRVIPIYPHPPPPIFLYLTWIVVE